MIKSVTNFLIIFFIFQQLKSQISQIDQNGYNAFCDETLHMLDSEQMDDFKGKNLILYSLRWVCLRGSELHSRSTSVNFLNSDDTTQKFYHLKLC